MAHKIPNIESLPNEILITILSTFPTCHLLPLATTSQLFHNLILRIIHQRLLTTASLPSHSLILECFHPSTKLTTPYLFCEYLGTDGLDDAADSLDKSKYADWSHDGGTTGRLQALSNLYSRFLPLKPASSPSSPRPHPAGGWIPANGGSSTSADPEEEPFVTQDVHLESHELFSQLMTIINLVKVGPKRGLFLSCVSLVDQTVRLWRDWLAEEGSKGKLRERGIQKGERDMTGLDKDVRWVDRGRNVGLRLGVVQDMDVGPPILPNGDEDVPVSYRLHFEELLIRTTQLLLMVEQSLEQEVSHSGKAIVIGSWDT